MSVFYKKFSKASDIIMSKGGIYMSEINVCGSMCEGCYCLDKICKGCNECEGKVFHAGGHYCPIYDCAVNQMGFKNCGECDKISCDIWRKTRDPNYSDIEFEANIAERLKRLEKGI